MGQFSREDYEEIHLAIFLLRVDRMDCRASLHVSNLLDRCMRRCVNLMKQHSRTAPKRRTIYFYVDGSRDGLVYFHQE